jgi:endonuclease/exonuclease/phosphatase family metal-dependent hydrolase
MRLLVRTWNLFHGNASPPERNAFLAEMIRLASSDEPDLLCLQELPVWSLRRLERWSGTTAVGAVAARPVLTPELGRMLTDLNNGLLRSALTGQANAVLIGPRLRLRERRVLVLNPWPFRRREARRLALGPATRIAWARERRVCQALRVEKEDGGTLALGNLHVTSIVDKRIPDTELLRAATFLDGFAAPGEPIVLAGDFNLSIANSHVLPQLTSPEWGFEGASPHGIDHLLVRDAAADPPSRWPDERRRIDGRLLSDHAPVEREVGL